MYLEVYNKETLLEYGAYNMTGYRYSRCFGVEEKAKKGPHFSLMLARNYRMESGKVEEISWEVVHRRNQRGPDVPNFPDILFTEKRDYLVKYNGQQVHTYMSSSLYACAMN